MPRTALYFYKAANGEVPVLTWLRDLRRTNRRAYTRCVAAVQELGAQGHELRRPLADYLQDGVYELRARVGRENYRVLYFFHGRNIAILTHALTKEAAIPKSDLTRALDRKVTFEADPAAHTYEEELLNG